MEQEITSHIELNSNQCQSIMSEQQLYQLKSQIMAYKYLIRNLQIPQAIQNSIQSLSQEQYILQKEKMYENAIQNVDQNFKKHHELKQIIEQKFNKKAEQSQSNQNELLNQYLFDQQNYFIEKRKLEIKSYLEMKEIFNEETITSLEMELNFLELKDVYNDLKQKIICGIAEKELKNLDQFDYSIPFRILEKRLVDRKIFKREKPHKKQEAKMLEKFEFQLKHDQEQRKKLKHLEFMNQLFSHQANFFEFHRNKYKLCKKFAIGSKIYLESSEKREQDKINKAHQMRIEKLKQNDIAGYLQELKNTKNQRIFELLNQTDKYLRKLGARVKLQKGDKQNTVGDEMQQNIEQDENFDMEHFDFERLQESNKVYYELTHSTERETIAQQPDLLIGGHLKSYQLVGLEWMVSLFNNKLNGILADEMGLGKTIQTIALFCYLMEYKKVFGPFLIVVPLSTLSNWRMEFQKWAPTVNIIIYKGPPQMRKQITHQLKTTKWNVCITTYEYVMKDRLVLHKFDWKYIIVDEGHRMKNARSKFAQTMGQILLTGTPLQNNLQELWSLLNFILPKVFNSCDDFQSWFGMAMNQNKNKNGFDDESQLKEEEQLLIINRLHQVLRPFLLRRVKKEVESELPGKTECVIKIQLSIWQNLVYEQIKQKGVQMYDSQGKIQAIALQNMMMQLRKICNHPYLFLDYKSMGFLQDMIWRCSGKFELLDRILPKLIVAGHRILMFCQMTQLMNIMEEFFQYRKFKYLRLDGSTKTEDREQRLAQFNANNSQYKIFLLSTRAGGLGLNLQTADTVIIFDSDWNPQMDLQAQDRAHRIGSKAEVRVLRLVTNTNIEEMILSKAAYKMGLDELYIQAGLFNQKSSDIERRQRIQDLLKKKHYYEELDDDIPNDSQVNEIIARDDEEIKRFDKMDKERYILEEKIFPNFKHPKKNDQKQLNYRLIEKKMVPQFIVKSPKVDEKQNAQQYGRGNRVRKEVCYADNLTDLQWAKQIEDAMEQESESDEQEEEYNQIKRKGRKKKDPFQNIGTQKFNQSNAEISLESQSNTESSKIEMEEYSQKKNIRNSLKAREKNKQIKLIENQNKKIKTEIEEQNPVPDQNGIEKSIEENEMINDDVYYDDL